MASGLALKLWIRMAVGIFMQSSLAYIRLGKITGSDMLCRETGKTTDLTCFFCKPVQIFYVVVFSWYGYTDSGADRSLFLSVKMLMTR